jgi:hypothetical protein
MYNDMRIAPNALAGGQTIWQAQQALGMPRVVKTLVDGEQQPMIDILQYSATTNLMAIVEGGCDDV